METPIIPPTSKDAGHPAYLKLRLDDTTTPDVALRIIVSPTSKDAGHPTPEESTEISDRKRLLHRALNRMSDKGREIIMLKEIQGLKLEEISDLLEVPVGTVKSRSNRARLELATTLRRLNPAYGAAAGGE